MLFSRILFLSAFFHYLSAAEPVSSSIELKSIERMMEEAFQKSAVEKIKPTDDVILFLGNTQVGKSTLINTLLGCTYVKKKEKNKPSYLELAEGSIIEFTKRGKTVKSETLYPEVHTNSEIPYLLCDTQGFSDQERSKEEPIVASVLLEMIVNSAKSVRIVLPFSEDQLTNDAARSIRDFCGAIDKLLKRRTAPILFLYNKKGTSENDDVACAHDRIQTLLKGSEERLEQLAREAESRPGLFRRLRAKLPSLPWVTESSSVHDVSDDFDATDQESMNNSRLKEHLEKMDMLWLLERMHKQATRNFHGEYDGSAIVEMNVLNPEEGKRIFFEGIKNLQAVSKEQFNFGSLSGSRPKFDQEVSKLLNRFTQQIHLAKEFKRYANYAVIRYENLENYLSYLECLIRDLQNKKDNNILLPETVTKRSSLENDIAAKRLQIKTKKEAIEKAQFTIKVCEETIAKLNNDESLAEVGEIQPFDKPVGFFCYGYHTVEQEVIPYFKVEQELDDNTKCKNLQEDRANGKFKAYYAANWMCNCKGQGKFYAKRKDILTTKESIQNNANRVTLAKQELARLPKEIEELEEEIKQKNAEYELSSKSNKDQLNFCIRETVNNRKKVKSVFCEISVFLTCNKDVELSYQHDERRMNIWRIIYTNLLKSASSSIANVIVNPFIDAVNEPFPCPITADLSCPITLETPDVFVNLPCGHIFSQEGIAGLEHSVGRATHISCPECRQLFPRGRHVNVELCEAQYDDLNTRYFDTVKKLIDEYRLFETQKTGPAASDDAS
ncbi:MAG TPA: hypothetical protein DIC42_06345 [Holosporales bacterium]|nr:hypothetical protein [Holosporales bacterium]